MDVPLSATLQFSTPLVNSISSWPEQHAEITRKLKKTQKALPPFGWDTEPVMGTEVIIEEAFMDVFCDLVYGGGWLDTEREESDRECNWALVSRLVYGSHDHRINDLYRSSSSHSRFPDQLFLAARTRALPPLASFLRSMCRSSTASSSLRASKARELWLLSSHPGRPSNGSKLPRSMDVLTLSGTSRGA